MLVEEASGKDNFENNDFLKSKITGKKITVNKKSVMQYDVKDYSRFIFCTNNKNALNQGLGNRRIFSYDTDPSIRGNVEYFKNLVIELNKPIVKWAFFQYLKTYNTYDTPIDFQNNIPPLNSVQ